MAIDSSLIEEAKKARQLLTDELDQKSNELIELQDVLKQRGDKLAEAQKAQADRRLGHRATAFGDRAARESSVLA